MVHVPATLCGRKNRNVMLGNIGFLLMNHLFLPFKRRAGAGLTAMSQEQYMRAFVGDDPTLWKLLPGYFTPGTPLHNEEGLRG